MKKVAFKILSVLLITVIMFSTLSAGISATNSVTKENLIISSDDVNNPLVIPENRYDNQKIKNLTFIGKGDIIIESYAFSNCTNLESISFESTGDIIFKGRGCFEYAGIKELYLPSNIKFKTHYVDNIEGYVDSDYLFDYCTSLEKVTIACDITDTFTMFRGCSSLKTVEFVVDASEMTVIPNSAFEDCSLENIVLPPKIQTIDGWAFFGNAFTNISIPASVQRIYHYAFANCDNMKSMYIPESVTRIEYPAIGFDWLNNGLVSPYDGFTIYGHTGSAAETYAVDNGFAFIPVDNIDSSITSTQASTGTVGLPSPVTLSVAGFPDYITTKSSLGSTQTIAREDAEIVTSESGEEWTFDVVPESETTELTVTATYCGGSLTATSEIAITAQKADTTTVKSVETTVPAVVGNTATVSVTVAESAEAIRFVNADSETITFGRETELVIDNGDSTETWTVSVPVTKETEEYTVYAKYAQTGWSTDGTEFTLKARVLNYSTEIESIEFEESLDGVIYQGVNKMTIVTADGMTKVQLMKDGNTWTYNEQNATYEDKDGQRIWTINMNFSQLGDHTYDIRVRSTKTSFQLADTLDLTVYAR